MLEKEISDRNLPLVLVEGVTDVAILSTAWSKLHPEQDMPFLIRAADPLANVKGTSGAGAGAVAKFIESIHPAEERKVIAIFDHDSEGIKAFEGLSKNFRLIASDTSFYKAHSNGYASAMTLAVADPTNGLVEAQNFCIEFLFDDEVLAKRDAYGYGLEIESQPACMVVANKRIPLPQSKLALFDDVIDLSVYKIIKDGKKTFSENIVPSLPVTKFDRFIPIFDKLCNQLNIEVVAQRTH